MSRTPGPLLLRLIILACVLGGASGSSCHLEAAGIDGVGPFDGTAGRAGNLERLERAASAAADSLLDAIGARDSLCLAVVPHDAAWLLEQALIERAGARGLGVRRCDRSDARRVDVAIAAIGVLYARIDEGLERVASIRLSSSAPVPLADNGAGGELRTFTTESSVTDTLAVADTTGLAVAAYPYTVGTIIDSDGGGFWSRIVEPAVVLAASAIVAILLFTVRSQ